MSVVGLRCVHISDLHYFSFLGAKNKARWKIFFSKALVGACNVLLSKTRQFEQNHLFDLIAIWIQQRIQIVFITGDLVTTASAHEFEMAKQFIDALTSAGLKVFLVPGNHDHYTKYAYKHRLFYQYFPALYPESLGGNLKMDGVCHASLGMGWSWIGLDLTKINSWIFSRGIFSESVEASLKKILCQLPVNEKLIFACHFPFTEQMPHKMRLLGRERLQALLKNMERFSIYLHGHTHTHCIADLRPARLPIVLCSGSVSHKPIERWQTIVLGENSACVTGYQRSKLDALFGPWELAHYKEFYR